MAQTFARLRNLQAPASQWTSNNPVLLDGEVGFESDTLKFKVGDGVSAWAALPYWTDEISVPSDGFNYGFTGDPAQPARTVNFLGQYTGDLDLLPANNIQFLRLATTTTNGWEGVGANDHVLDLSPPSGGNRLQIGFNYSGDADIGPTMFSRMDRGGTWTSWVSMAGMLPSLYSGDLDDLGDSQEGYQITVRCSGSVLNGWSGLSWGSVVLHINQSDDHATQIGWDVQYDGTTSSGAMYMRRKTNANGWGSWVSSGGGTITGVTAGTDLTGGGTSGTVTINHADTSPLNGTYGSTDDAIKIDEITVDARGHVTAITTGPVAGGGGGITGVTAGDGLTGGGTSGTVTVSHDDTSAQGSVNNSNGTVIQDVTLDTFGHVTGLTSTDLDDRYYTETEADGRFVEVAGDTMTGQLLIDVDDVATGALRINANQTNPDNDFYFAQEIFSALSGTTTTTADREQGGIYIDVNSSATGGDTSNEHRAYGVYVDLDSSGDSDVVTGIYADATATPTTGTTTAIQALYGRAEDNGGAGETTSVYAVRGLAVSDNASSDVNSLFGGHFVSQVFNDSAAVSNAYGIFAEIDLASGGSDVLGATYVVKAVYDNNTGVEQTSSAFLFHGDYQGTLPTNAYGLYIADDVTSYLGGNLGLGSLTPASKLDVVGTITADGLDVDGNATINSSNATPLVLKRSGGTDANTNIKFEQSSYNTWVGAGSTGDFVVGSNADLAVQRKFAVADNGDVSFYEDTGTTAKMTWDASADSLTFGDNVKATFGASGDLQIYHNGATSVVADTGSGSLSLQTNGDRVALWDTANSQFMGSFDVGSEVGLYYNGDKKFATTSTGIDVTGAITAEGLTLEAGAPNVFLNETDVTDKNTRLRQSAGRFELQSVDDNNENPTLRLRVYNDTGDIGFYEDTGTTAQMTWDASAEALTFGDNVKATFGAGSDLQIYHDGSDSFIEDQGTGNLQLKTNGSEIDLMAGTEYMVRAYKDGAVSLYNNGAVKLSTFSGGAEVTGAVKASSAVEVGEGSGSVALTINDGYGNANVTFNHRSGIPDQNGNSLRIETNVDSSTNAAFRFEGKSGVSSGVSTSLNELFVMTETGATCLGNEVWHAGNDGAGSGLDADLLDGQQGSYYYPASNPDGFTSNVGDITGVTAGTDLTGGGTSGTVTINHGDTSTLDGTYGSTDNGIKIDQITVDARGHVTAITTGPVAGGGDITGVTAGSGLTGGGTEGDVTVSHDDTSSQASVNNSNGTVIQDVTLDTFGHVTGLASANLDNRYLQLTGGTLTGSTTINTTVKIGTGANGSSNGDELVISKDQTNVGMSILATDGTGQSRIYLGSQTDTQAARIQHNENNDRLFVQAKGDLYLQSNGSNNRVIITSTGMDVKGSITLDGTVDGRDVAADGAKLDGITTGATVVATSPTAQGTFTVTSGDTNVNFPSVSPTKGIWLLENAHRLMVIELNSAGDTITTPTVNGYEAGSLTFVADKRPKYSLTGGGSRTIRYKYWAIS